MIRRAKFLAVTAGAAAVVLGGAGAALAVTAAPATGSVVYHGCEGGTAGRIIWDVYSNGTVPSCNGRGEWKFAFNAAGPQGPQGAQGAQGPQGPQGPPGASGATGPVSEVDNGAEFAVSSSQTLADTSAQGATYADAGSITQVGTVGNLSASALAFSGKGPLAENIWIGDGPQASVPGVYSLKGGADFCYGLGTNVSSGGQPAAFQMQSDCGSYAGKTLTAAQIAADFPANLAAYAWVGVVFTGANAAGVAPATISSVGSHKVNMIAGVLDNGGVLTPYTSPAS